MIFSKIMESRQEAILLLGLSSVREVFLKCTDDIFNLLGIYLETDDDYERELLKNDIWASIGGLNVIVQTLEHLHRLVKENGNDKYINNEIIDLYDQCEAFLDICYSIERGIQR